MTSPATSSSTLFPSYSALSSLIGGDKPLGCGRCGEEQPLTLYAVHRVLSPTLEPATKLRDFHWGCKTCVQKEIDRALESGSPHCADHLAQKVYFNCISCAKTCSATLAEITAFKASRRVEPRGALAPASARPSPSDRTPATERRELLGLPIHHDMLGSGS